MRVVVVGGGIGGLTAGWSLRNGPAADPTPQDVDVTVLEAGDTVGGKLRTGELAGGAFDLGAEAFLARRPEADRLARRLGLGDDLVEPAQSGVWLWRQGGLRRYPQRTVFGVPADPAALASAGVVSPRTIARAIAEPALARPAMHEDVSVSDALAPRFGHELVDTLVEPLLGGIYAGSPDRLSMLAATPLLASAARSSQPYVTFMRHHRQRTAHVTGPVFRTVDGGMQRLATALAADLDVRTGVAAVGLEQDGGRWVVHSTEGAEVADHVVLAVPAQVAAELLRGVAPVSSRSLRAVPHASSVVVATAWADATLPTGSGFLVPRSEGRLVKAATWSSNKWGHLGGADLAMVRFSVGRVDDRRGLDLDARILTELVLAEAREALGLDGEPVDVAVQRWPDGLPQYDIGHTRRIAAVTRGLPDGVHMTGALFDGVGVAPIVGHAESVAATIRQSA